MKLELLIKRLTELHNEKEHTLDKIKEYEVFIRNNDGSIIGKITDAHKDGIMNVDDDEDTAIFLDINPEIKKCLNTDTVLSVEALSEIN